MALLIILFIHLFFSSLVMLWEFAHAHVKIDRVPAPEPEFLDHIYPELVLRGQ